MHALAAPPDITDPITPEVVYRGRRLVQLPFPVPRGRRTRSTLTSDVRRVSLLHIPLPFCEPCGKQVAGYQRAPLGADGARIGETQMMPAVDVQETSRQTAPSCRQDGAAILTCAVFVCERPTRESSESLHPSTPPAFYLLLVFRQWLWRLAVNPRHHRVQVCMPLLSSSFLDIARHPNGRRTWTTYIALVENTWCEVKMNIESSRYIPRALSWPIVP